MSETINTAPLSLRIKAARAAKSMTQQALADKMNVHVQSVRNWEAGSTPKGPMLDLLRSVLKLYEDVPDDFPNPLQNFTVQELTEGLRIKSAEFYNVPADSIQVEIKISS